MSLGDHMTARQVKDVVDQRTARVDMRIAVRRSLSIEESGEPKDIVILCECWRQGMESIEYAPVLFYHCPKSDPEEKDELTRKLERLKDF